MKLWFERGAWVSKKARPYIESLDPALVKRVAVVRHAALGDMVLVRPFLVELHKFFPNAKIILSLVSNYTYGAPEDLVDEVHVMYGNEQKDVSVRGRVAQAKKLGEVDILFDLADTTRSRYLCLLAKAKIKVGFPYRSYLRNLLYDAAVSRSDFTFEAVNMLDMLMLFGANPAFPLDFAWPSEIDQAKVDKPYIVYFPFASIENKCWPKKYFVELIQSAAQNYSNYEHIVLGGIGDIESEQEYQAIAQDIDNVSLQAALPLEKITGFLKQATLVVANDTGVRNLAIATETPTVGIFFSTVPYRYWPRYAQHKAVFEATGELPSVNAVKKAIVNILGQ